MIAKSNVLKPFSFAVISGLQSLQVIMLIGLSAYTNEYTYWMISMMNYLMYYTFKTIFWIKMKRQGYLDIQQQRYIYIPCFFVCDMHLAISLDKKSRISSKEQKSLLFQYIQLELMAVCFLLMLAVNLISSDNMMNIQIQSIAYILICFLITFNRYNVTTAIYHQNRDRIHLARKIALFFYYMAYLQLLVFMFAFALALQIDYLSYIVFTTRIVILFILPIFIYLQKKTISKFYMKITYGPFYIQRFFHFLEVYLLRFEMVGFLIDPSPIIEKYSSKSSLVSGHRIMQVLRVFQWIEIIVFYSIYLMRQVEQENLGNSIVSLNVIISFAIYTLVTACHLIRCILNVTSYSTTTRVISLNSLNYPQQSTIQHHITHQLILPQDITQQIQYLINQFQEIQSMKRLKLCVFDLNHLEYQQIDQQTRLALMKFIIQQSSEMSIIVSTQSKYIYWHRCSDSLSFKLDESVASDLAIILEELELIPFKNIIFKVEEEIGKVVMNRLIKGISKHMTSIVFEAKAQKYLFEEAHSNLQMLHTIYPFQLGLQTTTIQIITYQKTIARHLLNNPKQLYYDLFD